LSEVTNCFRNNCETFALVTSPSSFDGSIECTEVGLERDIVDYVCNLFDFFELFAISLIEAISF